MVTKKEKLYIIGNGFDLHHGINSSYKNYLVWLIANRKDIYDLILKYYPDAVDKEWWNEFEFNLGFPDTQEVKYEIDNSSYYGQPSEDEIEEMRSISWDRGAWDIHVTLGLLIDQIKSSFCDWISSLESANSSKKLNLDLSNAIFLNFNYTKTLECLYEVEEKNILYIHGCMGSEHELIIGHGEDLPSIEETIDPSPSFVEIDDDEVENLRDPITENTYKAAIDEFYNLRKDVEAIMSENYSFFENLNDISQIFILGHSFSSIDQPYFDKIIKSIDLDRVSFIASYYSDEDYSKATQFFSDHGINKYRLVKLEDLMIHKQKQLSIDFPEEIHI